MLKALAKKYEREEFLVGDPSWFMHQVEGPSDQELLAFIASSLSYGSRKQFLPRIQYLMEESRGEVREWLLSGAYEHSVPDDDACFYRLYTNRTYRAFLRALAELVGQYGSLRCFVEAIPVSQTNMKTDRKRDALTVIEAITRWFRDHDSQGVIPKDATSSCKRVCMFLRWMTRDNSPVDLGLWSDLIDKRSLIIPMDTHVVQEAMRLGLLTSRSTSMSNARRLTQRLAEVFPDDPLLGDFALFGLGVDDSRT